MGSPFDELGFHPAFLARGVIVGRVAPNERERAVADRAPQEIGRGQCLVFGQGFPHPCGTVFGQFNGERNRVEPSGQLQQCRSFAGTRFQDETFACDRRPEPFHDGGYGYGVGGVEAAFDLRNESGHVCVISL